MKKKSSNLVSKLSFAIEYVDNEKIFKRRIVIREGNKVVKRSHFTSYYAGILTLHFRRKVYGCVTAYFEGCMPIERVFEIVTLPSKCTKLEIDPEPDGPIPVVPAGVKLLEG